MRAVVVGMILVMSLAGAAAGQDVRKAEDWKKMYQDVSAQLRAAQDRKSELAAANAKLATQVAELETGLKTANGELLVLREHAQRAGDQNLMLGAFYAGWEAFIQANPPVWERWRAFWGSNLGLWTQSPPFYNVRWDLAAQ